MYSCFILPTTVIKFMKKHTQWAGPWKSNFHHFRAFSKTRQPKIFSKSITLILYYFYIVWKHWPSLEASLKWKVKKRRACLPRFFFVMKDCSLNSRKPGKELSAPVQQFISTKKASVILSGRALEGLPQGPANVTVIQNQADGCVAGRSGDEPGMWNGPCRVLSTALWWDGRGRKLLNQLLWGITVKFGRCLSMSKVTVLPVQSQHFSGPPYRKELRIWGGTHRFISVMKILVLSSLRKRG